MIHLENHEDDLNNHDIWQSLRAGELTQDEVDEFREEFDSLIRDLRSEVESLDDKLEDAVRELGEGIPKCDECGDPLDDPDDSLCEDCDSEDE